MLQFCCKRLQHSFVEWCYLLEQVYQIIQELLLAIHPRTKVVADILDQVDTEVFEDRYGRTLLIRDDSEQDKNWVVDQLL